MLKATLPLTGKWEFREYPPSARRMRDLDSADWEQTEVPSSIFESLIEAGKINQADFFANPEKFSLVSEKPWIYRKIFDAPAELLECDRIKIVFDGLDTVTSIWLNDKLIGRTNNMFIPHAFDVTGLLRPKGNILLVKFESATQYAKKRMARYGSLSESGSMNPYRVYIRKAQYQFGWDFCPELPGCGIYRPVRLEGIRNAEFDNIHIRTVDCNPSFADVKVTVNLNTVMKKVFLCKIVLYNDHETFEHELHFEPGRDSNSTLFRIENPLLWWPAGYGQQNLYNIDAQLLSGGEVVDSTQKKFGIRTIKLNTAADEHGKNFRFEVNNQPVFAKGANWVPVSMFARCTSPQDYEDLLTAAAKANLNMLRVWGGGYYEERQFYELCDKLGIMVWQDFMFACAYYPDREWFHQEVKNEAKTIITLLRNHPCLALWCGNNEIDWMHADGKLGKGKKFYGRDIYHQLLPQLIVELNPDTNYIPTTPLIEKDKFKISHHLTTHQWDVWSGQKPVRNYRCPPESIPRFVTEFGMQSLPAIETIKKIASQEQMRIGSMPIEKHDYQLDGNSRLYRYIGDLFGSPQSLEQFIYLSQLTHARAAKEYVEHLRAHSLRNNGVVFWQFNDCFPAITWSAIDYNKNSKAIFFYAKRFFANRIIAAIPEWDTSKAHASAGLHSIAVAAINDTAQPLTAKMNCKLIDFFGRLLDQAVFPVMVAPFSVATPLKLPRALTLPDNPDRSCLQFILEKDETTIAQNLFFYLPDKYIDWPEAQITKHFSQITEHQWKLKLESSVLVKDMQVTAAAPAGFNDNFLDILPHAQREITIDFCRRCPSIEKLIYLRSINPAPA